MSSFFHFSFVFFLFYGSCVYKLASRLLSFLQGRGKLGRGAVCKAHFVFRSSIIVFFSRAMLLWKDVEKEETTVFQVFKNSRIWSCCICQIAGMLVARNDHDTNERSLRRAAGARSLKKKEKKAAFLSEHKHVCVQLLFCFSCFNRVFFFPLSPELRRLRVAPLSFLLCSFCALSKVKAPSEIKKRKKRPNSC